MEPGRSGVGFSKGFEIAAAEDLGVGQKLVAAHFGSGSSPGYWSMSLTTMSLSVPVVEA
jgi:hypothetical protein